MNNTQIVAVLEAAKAKIATPAQWTQNDYAKDAEGNGVGSASASAVCFCSIGAMMAVTDGAACCWVAVKVLTDVVGGNIVYFNDAKERTHAEVIAAWDKAIAIAKARLVVANLEAAKAKIATPEAWMQGFYAEDATGNQINGNDPSAVCFCAYGAVEAATGKIHGNSSIPEIKILDTASESISRMHASSYNDAKDRTHAEVLVLFDKAIELAKAEVKAIERA